MSQPNRKGGGVMYGFGTKEWADKCEKLEATIADLQGKLEAAQNELLSLREIVGEWCWNISNLTGDYAIKTVADFNEELTRRSVWLSETVRAALPAPQSNSDRQELQALQQRVAQLEGERDALKRDQVAAHACAKTFEQMSDESSLRRLLTTLQADHARVLGLVQALQSECWKEHVPVTGTQHDPANGLIHGYCARCRRDWPCEWSPESISASLPAQPAQGGV